MTNAAPKDGNAVLMGGSSAPAWSFAEPGTTHTGHVAEPPRAVQEREFDLRNPGGGDPKYYPSGDPIMGVHVTMNTTERDASDPEDDGTRTFYCEGRYLKEAVRNAVKATGAQGLEVGGVLSVTFTHREDPDDKRSRKYWSVTYTPVGNAVLMDDAPAEAPAPPPQPRLAAVPNPPAPAPAPAAAPAAAAPAGDAMAVLNQIKGFIALGMTDAQIAAVAGVEHSAIAAVRAIPAQ